MKKERYVFITLILTLLLCIDSGHSVAQHTRTPTTPQHSISSDSSSHTSAWSAMSHDFTLDDNAHHDMTEKQLRFFLAHRDYLHELTRNATPYLYYVYKETHRRGMPAEIALLPMIESNYHPFGVSTSGASGIWQIMPDTASGFGVKTNWWYDGRRDIKASTNAALHYLAYLHRYFGDWLLAIAAYNTGEGTVEAAIKHNKRIGAPTDFWSLPLPYETKIYVPKLLALARIFANPNQYHVHLPNIANHPYFEAVPIHGKVDLKHVATLSHTPLKTVRLLNPGFRHAATTPANQNYAVLLPRDHVDTYRVNAQKNTAKKQVLTPSAPTSHSTPHHLHHVTKKNLTVTASHPHQHNKQHKHQVPHTRHLLSHTHHKHQHNGVLASKHTHRPSSPTHTAYTYTVRRGDSLSQIAKQFDTSIHMLQHTNHLHGHTLRVGSTLTIPRKSHVG